MLYVYLRNKTTSFPLKMPRFIITHFMATPNRRQISEPSPTPRAAVALDGANLRSAHLKRVKRQSRADPGERGWSARQPPAGSHCPEPPPGDSQFTRAGTPAVRLCHPTRLGAERKPRGHVYGSGRWGLGWEEGRA